MEEGCCLEESGLLAGRMLYILWNSMVHYRDQKNSPLASLSKISAFSLVVTR